MRIAVAFLLFSATLAPATAAPHIAGRTKLSLPAPGGLTSVLTYHNDNNRTGWNSNETVLTTANVNAANFGLLQTVSLDGRVDGQPLVVPSVPIAGQGTHDVVYVATENDTVYAIDAESGAVLMSRSLGQAVISTSKQASDTVAPTYGVLSTPVIDTSTFAIYLVTDANEGVSAPDVYRLHMLSLVDFTDLAPAVALTPTTTLSNGATYTFNPHYQRQRPALLDANGAIYVAFGGMDAHPAMGRGIIAGFNNVTLAPLANTYLNRSAPVIHPFVLTSIWQSGYGPAADARGNLFFATGNSSPYSHSYLAGYNYPDSVLKMSPDLTTIVDSFTQWNYFTKDVGDADLGSGGTLVVPDQAGIYPHLVLAGGKDGKAYVLNADALGGYTANGPNADLRELNNGACWCGPAYFVGSDSIPRLVTGGGSGVATWRLTDDVTFAIAREGQVLAGNTNGQPDLGGTFPVISSNATTAGSHVLWFVQRPKGNDTTLTLNLRAFDAMHLGKQLYAAPAGHWNLADSNANVVPTVANGYVYVASYMQLQIFGLLATPHSAIRR